MGKEALAAGNCTYIEEREDGNDPAWAAFVAGLEQELRPEIPTTVYQPKRGGGEENASKTLLISNLINAYRCYGHLAAHTNPLHAKPPPSPKELELVNLNLSNKDLPQTFPTLGTLPTPSAPLQEIIHSLKNTYCKKIGIEYMLLSRPHLEAWLQQQIEPTHLHPNLSIQQKQSILQHLNKSELFEAFLQTKYTGQKRFSLEGAVTLIPMLATLLESSPDHQITHLIIGMAHRGRLNVLSNILNKSYPQIFSEFNDNPHPDSIEGSGDVKYHKGFQSTTTINSHEIHVALSPNPSHLESVDPVVQGYAHAKQISSGQQAVLPILIHGDASLAGQGVIYETLQLYNLPGYANGGTLHIVINNQIGFTTLPTDGRSTPYCTDIAKTFGAPVFHVNAEDPEGCVHATLLALAIRQTFHIDVFIDLLCYRKYGHNETDEPAFTQPLEYQEIRQKKPIREMYRDALIEQGVVEKYVAESLEKEFKEALSRALELETPPTSTHSQSPAPKEPPAPVTKVDKKTLKAVSEGLVRVPAGFTPHAKLEKLLGERLKMGIGEIPLNWGAAELLAYGTLLWEGHAVRLAGQDSARGTFSHRHALWMDQKTGSPHIPLKHLRPGQGPCEIVNSLLSEYAAMGFEYGYSLAKPNTLTIWEAQFGDFANGAQVIIDQYLVTAEQKWDQFSGLTLLLPHGYEGQGPEHSSGRIERFLALAGHDNLRIVQPTTPAQFFHLLRRQALTSLKRPLIIFTPKALLRHPACTSAIDALADGAFQPILDDPSPAKRTDTLVFCTGKIYYEIAEKKPETMTLVRIEQLYPIDRALLKELIDRYSPKRCLWVQEEPRNMGAWFFMRPILRDLLDGIEPEFIGRERSASTAVGSFAKHKRQQQEILEQVFESSTTISHQELQA